MATTTQPTTTNNNQQQPTTTNNNQQPTTTPNYNNHHNHDDDNDADGKRNLSQAEGPSRRHAAPPRAAQAPGRGLPALRPWPLRSFPGQVVWETTTKPRTKQKPDRMARNHQANCKGLAGNWGDMILVLTTTTKMIIPTVEERNQKEAFQRSFKSKRQVFTTHGENMWTILEGFLGKAWSKTTPAFGWDRAGPEFFAPGSGLELRFFEPIPVATSPRPWSPVQFSPREKDRPQPTFPKRLDCDKSRTSELAFPLQIRVSNSFFHGPSMKVKEQLPPWAPQVTLKPRGPSNLFQRSGTGRCRGSRTSPCFHWLAC